MAYVMKLAMRGWILLLAGLLPLGLLSCSSSNTGATGGQKAAYTAAGPSPMMVVFNSPLGYDSAFMQRTSPQQMLNEVDVEKDFIRAGTHARKVKRPMQPRYITIHSTQNYSPSADAQRHSLALKNGKLRAYKREGGNRIGYLAWHYSVDENDAVQHMPTNEQGEHADFDGPGNRYSIGIEMCENRGNSRAKTIDRTAKLSAYLMWKHDIPLQNVVPHYHWPRRGLSNPHKNCPHYLLDNGKPGAKWAWFLNKVNDYHKEITSLHTMNL